MGCSNLGMIPPPSLLEHFSWGSIEDVYRLKHIWGNVFEHWNDVKTYGLRWHMVSRIENDRINLNAVHNNIFIEVFRGQSVVDIRLRIGRYGELS